LNACPDGGAEGWEPRCHHRGTADAAAAATNALSSDGNRDDKARWVDREHHDREKHDRGHSG
jgi:hypothetical protein